MGSQETRQEQSKRVNFKEEILKGGKNNNGVVQESKTGQQSNRVEEKERDIT